MSQRNPVKRRFLDRVVELHRAGPAKGIEMSAVTESVCRHFVYPTPFVLHFSAAHLEAYQADPAGYLLRMRAPTRTWPPILRSPGSGVRSCSAPPSGPFRPVPDAAYWDSIRLDIQDAPARIQAQPLYLTLNLCRALAWRRERRILSKAEGGAWGLGPSARRLSSPAAPPPWPTTAVKPPPMTAPGCPSSPGTCWHSCQNLTDRKTPTGPPLCRGGSVFHAAPPPGRWPPRPFA